MTALAAKTFFPSLSHNHVEQKAAVSVPSPVPVTTVFAATHWSSYRVASVTTHSVAKLHKHNAVDSK